MSTLEYCCVPDEYPGVPWSTLEYPMSTLEYCRVPLEYSYRDATTETGRDAPTKTGCDCKKLQQAAIATTATMRTSAVEDAARRHDLDRLAVELGNLLLRKGQKVRARRPFKPADAPDVPQSIARGGRSERRCPLLAAARFHYPHRYCGLSVPLLRIIRTNYDPSYASLPLALIIRTAISDYPHRYCGLSAPLLRNIRTNHGPNVCIPTPSTHYPYRYCGLSVPIMPHRMHFYPTQALRNSASSGGASARLALVGVRHLRDRIAWSAP
jgi:hypothetical protein